MTEEKEDEDEYEPDKDAEKCIIEKREKKEKRKLTIELDLDDLEKPTEYQSIPNYEVWEKEEDMSPEFTEMITNLRYLMIYIARCMNEGPEVKDNVMKRMVAIRTLLDEFFNNININGYLLWGILYETMSNCYMNLTGRQKVIDILRQIQIRKTQMEAQKRRQSEKVYVA
jgi:hypothetical protein